MIARVEQQDAQMFLLQSRHFILHQGSGIRRTIDDGTFLGRFEGEPPPQFNGGLDLCGFGLADAMLIDQFLERGLVQTAQTAELLQKTLSHLHCVLTLHTHSQQNGDQLGIT